ncbi:MAG TPA: F0F1 ATP synthase subunit beta [Candidatus Saccharimonadia bacterium]|jgi:F-type H+-transporting ATPase subunit beta
MAEIAAKTAPPSTASATPAQATAAETSAVTTPPVPPAPAETAPTRKAGTGFTGHIVSIRGLIVEVAFPGNERPPLREVLSIEGHPDIMLEVNSYNDRRDAICIAFVVSPEVKRGAKVVSTGTTIAVPTGAKALGRLYNAVGQAADHGPEQGPDVPRRSIYTDASSNQLFGNKDELLETGIKVLDFFTPFVKGRKIGIIGGAGVGKTVLIMEIINNVGKDPSKLAFFAGIGERIREGHELYETLKERDMLKSTAMFYGQMNENPAMRAIVGLSATTLAEYFRDEEKKDILFFVDNVYRHIQAGNELSTMMGQIPSEGGYQATIFSDLKRFQDRLYSNANGSITAVETIYVPADDLTDPAVQEISSQIDSVIVLSRQVAEMGIRPAVDLIRTSSSLVTPEVVGDRHYLLVTQVQAIMQKYDSLKNIIAIIGENELSPQDRADYQKAKKLIEFFSQTFFVTEKLNGIPGAYFSREQTLSGIEEILI